VGKEHSCIDRERSAVHGAFWAFLTCDTGGDRVERAFNVGWWMPKPTLSDFDPEQLQGEVPNSRYEDLLDGARPTQDEFRLWREGYIEDAFRDSSCYMAYVYRISGESGREMYCVTYHGDGGRCEDSSGPFETLDEAMEELNWGVFRT